MLGGLRGRWLLLTGIAAVLAGTLLGFWFGAPIGRGLSVVAETLARSVGWRTTARPEVLSLPGNEMAKDAPSTTQSLTGFDELSYAVYELVGGRRTNFQNVKTFPKNSLIRQLANGVGSLRIKFKGQDDSHACTAFVITDKPGATYALTAGHCFYQDGVCPTAKASDNKAPPVVEKMYLVFNQFENTQFTQNDNTNPNAIPASLVKGELNCGSVDSIDKSKPYVDYAIVKLDDAKFQAHRILGVSFGPGNLSADNQIAPVSLGVVPIKRGHQLLILSQPDGRALMATERNCLATEHPDQPNGSFAHYCDTLKGSSGAPVFSRDHAVVAGLHTRSQYNPFAAGEEHIAIPIETIVSASPLLQKLKLLIQDPMTSEQQKVADSAKAQAKESLIQLFSGDAAKARIQAENASRSIDARTDSKTLHNNAPEVTLAKSSSKNFVRELSERPKILWSNDAIFSPDGLLILSYGGSESVVGAWSGQSGDLRYRLVGHADSVTEFSFSPDATRIVTASRDNTARLWDTRTGKALAVLVGHENGVNSASFSPDGSRVLTASADRTVRIWNAQDGKPIVTLSGHYANVISASFSPDGSRVLTASADKTVRIWNAQDGKPIVILTGHKAPIYAATFSPTGKTLATAAYDNTVRLWNTATGLQIAVLRGSKTFGKVVYSRDGSRLLTTQENIGQLWDVQTGRQLGASFRASEAGTTSLTFSPGGERAIIGSEDGILSLVSTEDGYHQIAKWRGHVGAVAGLAVSPDGTFIVSASKDNTVRLWRMSN